MAEAILRSWIVGALLVVLIATKSADSRVLVEAHRGDSMHAPENTVASILSAVGSADLTEFDVRVTADGALVLMHDSTVNRTTDGSGAVASLTLAAIELLDAGSWFSATFAGEPVPTMGEAIETSLTNGITPLIERKAGSAQAYHSEFIRLGLAANESRVISFDWSFLDDLNALNADYNLGALGSGTLDQSTIDNLLSMGVDFVDWSHVGIGQSKVDLVHANGMELHTWTVDSSSRMQQLIDMGVDGITTNNPALLHQLVVQASRTADLNMDNMVDAADWLAYNAGRGADLMGLSLEEAYQMGDMDGDFVNDMRDFVIFKDLYLAESASSVVFETLATVPEPTSLTTSVWCLLLLGRDYRPAREFPTVDVGFWDAVK